MRNNRMHTMHRSVYSDTSGYKNHHLIFVFPYKMNIHKSILFIIYRKHKSLYI